MKKLIFMLFVIGLVSCDNDPYLDIPAEPSALVGVWQEIESDTILQLGGNTHRFEFSEDYTFRVLIKSWNDFAFVNDPCSNFKWNEYASGIYKIEGQTIELDGFYTDANFNIKITGCHHTGPYIFTMSIHFQDEKLIFNRDQFSIQFPIVLEKETTPF